MKRTMLAAAVVVAGLVPSTADAAIPQVFTKTASPVNCVVQASGQRFCGTSTAQIPSFDGIPLDVSVAFPPAPADGSPDGPYPVIGMFHGWGGSKLRPDRRRRPAQRHPRLRRLHDDRPRLGRLLRAHAGHRSALRRQGLHPPDAQRLRGARRAVRARPARRRRPDRPAEDRRHRRLLRRRHVDRARRAARTARSCPTARSSRGRARSASRCRSPRPSPSTRGRTSRPR